LRGITIPAEVEILTPQRLDPPGRLVVAFATRKGGVSPSPYDSLNFSPSTGDSPERVRQNRRVWLQALGVKDYAIVQGGQIHSATIRVVERAGVYPETDGFVTVKENLFLTISTADCLPVMAWGPNGKVIGAAHAGWRGTLAGIVKRLLETMCMVREFSPAEISLCVGPGICGRHYEVGPEFRTYFSEKWLITRGGRLFFDNPLAVRDQALEFGLKPENVEILPYCTFEDAERFFSHRRDGEKTGRMWSLIGVRNAFS